MTGRILKENLNIRNKIYNLEKIMEESLETGELASGREGQITYKHLFTEKHEKHNVGLYAREMTAPKGALIIGFLHKEEHITFINKGRMKVLSESNGSEILEAPMSFVSPRGARRVIFCLEDCVMTCVYLSADPDADKEGLSDELEEDLTPFEESLLTDDYKQLGLSPPSEQRSQGVLEWLA